MLGAQYYETDARRTQTRDLGQPEVGVGKHCKIDRAILDMNCRIGDNVSLSPQGKADGAYLDDAVWVRDGVLVVTKNAIIPTGTRF